MAVEGQIYFLYKKTTQHVAQLDFVLSLWEFHFVHVVDV